MIIKHVDNIIVYYVQHCNTFNTKISSFIHKFLNIIVGPNLEQKIVVFGLRI